MTKHMLLTETEAPNPSGAGDCPAIWIRLPVQGHCPHSGLSRATYYELIKDGRIRSANLRKPGALRGIRLVWLPSVMAYLDRFATGGETK